LSFELSAPSEAGCVLDTTTLAAEAPCTVVRAFRRQPDGRLEPVRLYRGDQDHSAGAGALELRFDSRRIAFDAPLTEGEEVDLEIAVYVDRPWEPAYGATVENVRPEQGTVRVRLHPYRRWACPGRVIDPDERLEPRALHRAVRLDDGSVLLLGGITGEGIDPAGAGRPGRVNALLQPAVEVFVDQEHRFRRVELVGGAFARVLFDAFYVGRDADGRHRIRAVGGLQTASGREGSAVLAFDNSGLLAPLGAPFAPTDAAEAAPTVDLLYDPARFTLEVVAPPVDLTGSTRGAAITVSDPLQGGGRVVLMGLTRTGAGWLPADSYFPTGTPTGAPLSHARLGATVTPLPDIDRFLVWGGNLSTTPMVLETAGELVDLAGSTLAVSALVGLPAPVAFHSATPVDDGQVLLAGGLTVEASGTLRATASADPLVALTVDAVGTVTAVDVPDGTYVPTVLHTATSVPGLGVVLVGGAAVQAGDRLTPVATVGHVAAASLTHDAALQDLAEARFGHTATLLPGNRLLVVGGLGRTAAGLRALSLAELMLLADPPHPEIRDGQCVDQGGTVPDGGVSMPDGGTPMELDGGTADAGP
jgi:hypothetical protein